MWLDLPPGTPCGTLCGPSCSLSLRCKDTHSIYDPPDPEMVKLFDEINKKETQNESNQRMSRS